LSSNCTNSFDFCNAIFEKSLTNEKISLNRGARALIIEALESYEAQRSIALVARVVVRDVERRAAVLAEASRMTFSNVA